MTWMSKKVKWGNKMWTDCPPHVLMLRVLRSWPTNIMYTSHELSYLSKPIYYDAIKWGGHTHSVQAARGFVQYVHKWVTCHTILVAEGVKKCQNCVGTLCMGPKNAVWWPGGQFYAGNFYSLIISTIEPHSLWVNLAMVSCFNIWIIFLAMTWAVSSRIYHQMNCDS